MIFLIIAISVAMYFNCYVNPNIININLAVIKGTTIENINNSISYTLSKNDYDSLITISKDNNGDIVLMQVNSNNVNKLNCDIIDNLQNILNKQTNLKFSVPLGNFTGLPILNGIGPKIDINILPIGNANTKYNSQIANIGINQSYHKIYIAINVTVCILLPLYTQNINVSNQILVAESLLVGKIPNVYLNTDNLTNALNLIP